jgi:hypothetical protein
MHVPSLATPSVRVHVQHKTRHFLMFGDHKQLPATILSRAAENAGLGRSFFERIWGKDDVVAGAVGRSDGDGVCRATLKVS